MIYYGNPCSDEIKDEMSLGDWLGCILTPNQGNLIEPEWDIIADNGCFSDKWEAQRWWEWLKGVPTRARFAVAPDVVDLSGGETHQETVELWDFWSPLMVDLGHTPAFVLHEGATLKNTPFAEAYFIGGSTEFKLGKGKELGTQLKDRRGSWLHMGRVNSRKRTFIAHYAGCDSVDGTYLTYGPDVLFPKLKAWMAEVNTTPNGR